MGAGLALVAALTVDRAARAAEHTAASGASECNTSNLLAGRSPSAAQEVAGNAVLVTDGVIAPEGTPWDSPDAVRLAGTSAFLIFDLGGTHKVSALYLQADANDTYTISGSRAGRTVFARDATSLSVNMTTDSTSYTPGSSARLTCAKELQSSSPSLNPERVHRVNRPRLSDTRSSPSKCRLGNLIGQLGVRVSTAKPASLPWQRSLRLWSSWIGL